MYRKQRLTPKLRKKQKIVVSTPQNLWYDTGNNPAQKGKTADMEKVEISGAALAPLFRLSRDAVCGIAQGRIVFSNPAAVPAVRRGRYRRERRGALPGPGGDRLG